MNIFKWCLEKRVIEAELKRLQKLNNDAYVAEHFAYIRAKDDAFKARRRTLRTLGDADFVNEVRYIEEHAPDITERTDWLSFVQQELGLRALLKGQKQ